MQIANKMGNYGISTNGCGEWKEEQLASGGIKCHSAVSCLYAIDSSDEVLLRKILLHKTCH